MENNRENEEKIGQENRLPNGVAEAISVQSGRRVENVEEEMAEAIQKMNKLIDDKIFLLQHENEGLVIDAKQASETKDIAKLALINAMLNQTSLDEIDVILNSAVVEAIKHVDPREQEEEIEKPKSKEAIIHEHISATVSENATMKQMSAEQKMQEENKKFGNTFENLGINAQRIIDGLEKDLEEFFENTGGKESELNKTELRKYKALTLAAQMIVDHADAELDEEARDDILRNISTIIACQEDPMIEENLVILCQMAGLESVVVQDENGNLKIDRDECKKVLSEEIGYEYNQEESLENLDSMALEFEGENLPKDMSGFIKLAKRKNIEVKLLSVITHGTPEEVASLATELAELDLEYAHDRYLNTYGKRC